MIDLHTHSLFSDGDLLPTELVRRCEVAGYRCVAITDHADASLLDFTVPRLVRLCKELAGVVKMKVKPGVELTHVRPEHFARLTAEARRLGAEIIVAHGETLVEPVIPGTNRAAIEAGVDILAHPGWISEEDTILAKVNEIYLELSARKGHRKGNRHVVKMAKQFGAKLLVDTDSHSEKDLITQKEAYLLAIDSGLKKEEAIRVIRDNPQELVRRIERR